MARSRPIVLLNTIDHPVGTRLLWTILAGTTAAKGPFIEHPREMTILEWSPDGRVRASTPHSRDPCWTTWYGLDTVAMMGVLEILHNDKPVSAPP